MIQRIPALSSSVKPTRLGRRERATFCGLATLVTALTACGPMVDRAAFSVRPDTLDRGDLLGPFEGIVVDAETDRPVSGAVVSASWAFERGLGLVAPYGAHEVTLETDGDGRYRVERLTDLPSGLSTRIRRFTLIVYKRGYTGWRSDNKFPGGARRRDFSQRGNRVRLDKWHAGDLHHQHLAFLGGGIKVKEASSWEIQPATLELDGGRTSGDLGETALAGSGSEVILRQLDVTPLLAEEDVRGVTGFAGKFELARLVDLPRTEFYDTRHFKAVGQPETFDVALRVWRLGPTASEEQYRRVLAELPGAARSTEIGDLAVRAHTQAVRALVFLSRAQGTVVSVTCGVLQCTDEDMVLRLAKLVEGHLSELPIDSTPTPSVPAGVGPLPGVTP